MIYLDYSATTPVNKDVLDSFSKACLQFPGNPNSLHRLGIESNQLISQATEQIAHVFGVKSNEIIYTSGSSEANNLAIKGIAFSYQQRGKHIITTDFEHSSIYGPLGYLQKLGFEVDFVGILEDGTININELRSLIRDDTILVTINVVNSELGIIQPVDEIGLLLKDYPKCFFHIDMTQAVGKIDISLDNVDLASFSAHKFFGLKGVGALIKKEKILLEPIIHGGKSTTIYRSGTPALPLIVSTAKAIRLATMDLNQHYSYVESLNHYLREGLKTYENVRINSPLSALPYILNISVLGVKPETFLHALESHEVYISTQTACSTGGKSKAIYALTKSEECANSSLRISLSYLTTKKEIEDFLDIFSICYEGLTK